MSPGDLGTVQCFAPPSTKHVLWPSAEPKLAVSLHSSLSLFYGMYISFQESLERSAAAKCLFPESSNRGNLEEYSNRFEVRELPWQMFGPPWTGPEVFSHADKKLCIPPFHSIASWISWHPAAGFWVNGSRSGRARAGGHSRVSWSGGRTRKMTAWVQILAALHKSPVRLGR